MTDNELQQLLPSAPDAERALLSSFLIAPREVGNLCAERHIGEADFHIPANATIYRHLHKAWSESRSLDLITLTNAVRDAGELDECGGAANLSELGNYPTAAMAGEYIEILSSKTTLRRIHLCCAQFARQAVSGSEDAANLLLSAQTALAGISVRGPVAQKSFRAVLMETVDSIERGDDAAAHIESGIASLDELVRMRRGNFIVIGGEAKSGKTALAGGILAHAAIRQERRCAMFSLEMSAVELVKRCIASEGRVNVAMMGRTPAEHEVAGVHRGVAALANADIELVCDTYELGQIVARARQLHAKKPLDLIVLDYLQLVEFSTGRKGETRQEIVAQISRTCKRMAGEMDCVVVGLSQLNDDGKLRESRAIGQDANAVIAVEKDDNGGRTLRIAAQRNGASGVTAAVQWLPQFTKFQDRI